MTEFPSNSFSTKGPKNERKATPDKPKIEKVVQGSVVRRKKTVGQKFAETFFGNAKNVWGFVVVDILIPAVRDTIADAATQGLEGMIYGESRRGRSRSSRGYGSGSHVPYDRMSRDRGGRGMGYRNDDRDRSRMSSRARSRHDFDEIVFPKRVEAEEVLNMLDDLITQYGEATVANFYEMAGENADYTDQKWGWRALPGAGVDRINGGFVIDLPRPIALDD